jgi:hypothetical protein
MDVQIQIQGIFPVPSNENFYLKINDKIYNLNKLIKEKTPIPTNCISHIGIRKIRGKITLSLNTKFKNNYTEVATATFEPFKNEAKWITLINSSKKKYNNYRLQIKCDMENKLKKGHKYSNSVEFKILDKNNKEDDDNFEEEKNNKLKTDRNKKFNSFSKKIPTFDDLDNLKALNDDMNIVTNSNSRLRFFSNDGEDLYDDFKELNNIQVKNYFSQNINDYNDFFEKKEEISDKKKFEQKKDDFITLYEESYFKSIEINNLNMESYKLEYNLLIEKIFELMQLYHAALKSKKNKYKNYLNNYKINIQEFVIINKMNNKFKKFVKNYKGNENNNNNYGITDSFLKLCNFLKAFNKWKNDKSDNKNNLKKILVIILKKQNQNLKILNTNQINFLNKNFNAEININNNNNNKNNSNLNLKNPTNISKKGTFNKTSNNKDIKKKPSKLTIKRKNKK